MSAVKRNSKVRLKDMKETIHNFAKVQERAEIWQPNQHDYNINEELWV